MANNAVVQALGEYFTACGPDGDDWREAKAVGEKLAKRKDLKRDFSLIARALKNGSRDLVIQLCLQAPPAHPLHQAVEVLLKDGSLHVTPWVALASGPLPAREVTSLHVSKSKAVVYALELGLCVSVWSLETGAHLQDLKIPAKRGMTVAGFVELEDGTLRCLVVEEDGPPKDAVVFEKKPAAAAFTKAITIPSVGRSRTNSPDLRFVVSRPDFHGQKTASGPMQRVLISDVTTGKTQEVRFPGGYADNFEFAAGRAYFGVDVTAEVDDEEQIAESFLAILDPATGTMERVPLKQRVSSISQDGVPGLLQVVLVDEEGERTSHLFEVATRKLRKGDGTRVSRELKLPDGTSFDQHIVTAADGKSTFAVSLEGDPHNQEGAVDPVRGHFIAAGSDGPAPVVVLVPHGSQRPAAVAPVAAPQPLSWARPGVVLQCQIADDDAEDAWSFEVVEAGDELVIRARMDGKAVVDAMRFTAKALSSAGAWVMFAQGGADVDAKAPQSKLLPPFLVSRGHHKKLSSGKEATFTSGWSGEVELGGSAAQASINVDGTQQPASTIKAAGGTVQVTLLDDATWPLVLECTDGDCFFRVLSVDTSGVKDAPAKAAKAPPEKTPTAKAAAPTTAATKGVRRFEFNEGGSSKFWEVSVSGASMTVRFGKIGTAGQTQAKSFDGADEARREAEKLVKEKSRKGYVEQPA